MTDMILYANKTTEDLAAVGQPRQFLKGTRYGDAFTADWLWHLTMQGKVYTASGATVTANITGATSFANTTPTYVLSVPAGTTCIPLEVQLTQDGTVAGNTVNVHIGYSTTDLYSSGGSSVTPVQARTDITVANACTFRTGPTSSAITYGKIRSYVLGQDVAPAEGAPNGIFWQPERPRLLVGAACFWIFTYAGTTGPTFDYSVTWAEIPTTAISG